MQVNDCKRHMNTFAFVGNLEDSPEVSCVYHSEQARVPAACVAAVPSSSRPARLAGREPIPAGSAGCCAWRRQAGSRGQRKSQLRLALRERSVDQRGLSGVCRVLQAEWPQPELHAPLGAVVLLRPHRDTIVHLQPSDARRKDDALRAAESDARHCATRPQAGRTAPAAARIDWPMSATLRAAPGPESGITVPALMNTWPNIFMLRSVACGSCASTEGNAHQKGVRCSRRGVP